jgi:hypothetical protein
MGINVLSANKDFNPGMETKHGYETIDRVERGSSRRININRSRGPVLA